MEERRLSLTEHLEELRGIIIKTVVFIIFTSIFVYTFINRIIPGLVKPAGKVVFITPQEAFVTNIKIAFFGGLFFALPFILYQIWSFISAGLEPDERKYSLIFGPLSLLFFILGVTFGYYIIVPIGMKFLLDFASDYIVPMLSFSKYVSFVGTLTFAFGLVFQLPLVISFLTKIGVVTPKLLASKRKHAIVFIFIAAASLTPPDAITQVLMAVPLILLYELGLILSKMIYRDRQKLKHN